MNPLIRIFFAGLLISFLGTLPLGTLNISAMQIAISDGLQPALLFAGGAMFVEIVYVRISLTAMDWVRKRKRLFRFLEWLTLLLILALAFFSFQAASDATASKHPVLSGTRHRFWLGVLMSAVNPLQIPFWFGWSSVLFSRQILRPAQTDYNVYIAGIGLGTILGFLLFIFGGRLVVEKLDSSQRSIHIFVGLVFLLTALLQGVKMARSGWEKKTGSNASQSQREQR